MRRILASLIILFLVMLLPHNVGSAMEPKKLTVCLFNQEGHLVLARTHNVFLDKGTYGLRFSDKRYSHEKRTINIKVTEKGIYPSVVCILGELVSDIYPEAFWYSTDDEFSAEGGILITSALATALDGKKNIQIPLSNGTATVSLDKCSLTEDTILKNAP